MPAETPDRPFAHTPDPSRFVAVLSTQKILEELSASVRDGDGLVMLTGPWGVGKTQITLVLSQQLQEPDEDGGAFQVVTLQSGQITTRRGMLQAMLHELSEPYQGLTEQESRLGLLDVARRLATDKRRLVVVLDEAHLATTRHLEELRSLTNFVTDGQPLVRVVLVGNSDLDDRLSGPELEAVNQRIVCQLHMTPLTAFESAEYVNERLAAVGLDPDASFTPDALTEICHVAAGRPRAINLLAERAMEIAGESSDGDRPSAVVTQDDVLAALDVLEPLPMPWRRPLVSDNRSWSNDRRADDMAKDAEPSPSETTASSALEPLNGEVVEIGGESDDSAPAVPKPNLEVFSPLARMSEVFDELPPNLAALLPGTAAPETNDTPTAEEPPTSDEATADESDLDETSVDERTLKEEFDTLVDESAANTGTANGETDVDPADENSADEEVLDEFVTSSVDDHLDATDAWDDSAASDDAHDADEDGEFDLADPFLPTAESPSWSVSRDRADSAEKLLDAIVPLVADDHPSDDAIETLETMLDEASPDLTTSHGAEQATGSGHPDGEESTVGRTVLNLAAEVESVLRPEATPAFGDHAFDTPSFAFEPPSAESPSPQPSASTPVENAPPTEPAIETPVDIVSESAPKRRLEGLFTRLRRDRGR